MRIKSEAIVHYMGFIVGNVGAVVNISTLLLQRPLKCMIAYARRKQTMML